MDLPLLKRRRGISWKLIIHDDFAGASDEATLAGRTPTLSLGDNWTFEGTPNIVTDSNINLATVGFLNAELPVIKFNTNGAHNEYAYLETGVQNRKNLKLTGSFFVPGGSSLKFFGFCFWADPVGNDLHIVALQRHTSGNKIIIYTIENGTPGFQTSSGSDSNISGDGDLEVIALSSGLITATWTNFTTQAKSQVSWQSDFTDGGTKAGLYSYSGEGQAFGDNIKIYKSL